MSAWIKTLDDAITEARAVDDPCCADCTRTALTLLADEVERLRAMEARLRDDYYSDKDPHGTLGRYLGEG